MDSVSGLVVGRWVADASGGYLQSEDFSHDVRLAITGDFATQEIQQAYAQALAAQLNAAQQPAGEAVMWRVRTKLGSWMYFDHKPEHIANAEPLFTTPADSAQQPAGDAALQAGEAVHPVLWVDPMELAAVQIHGGMIVATAHEEASSKRTQPLYPSTPADSAPLVEALREIQSVAYSDQEDATVESICGWLQEITDAALAAYDASHEAGGQS